MSGPERRTVGAKTALIATACAVIVLGAAHLFGVDPATLGLVLDAFFGG